MKNKIKFFVMVKDFSLGGDIQHYDVMPSLYGTIFTSKGKLSKRDFYILDDKTYKRKEIKEKKDLKKFINSHFRYHYWGKCEWEFIVQDWPTHFNSKDIKVDVYEQLKPNIDLITDIVWEQVKDKIEQNEQ